MQKGLISAMTALAMIVSGVAATPAMAQDRDQQGDRYDRNDRQGNYGDQRHDREDRRSDRRGRQQRRWHYYGGQYGYNGYQGNYRTGQRYPYYNARGYELNNYSAYGLPAPRRGYRYYRDNNGDVVMAAVATGVIALIIGGALNGNSRYGR